jgi:hypothetical protein
MYCKCFEKNMGWMRAMVAGGLLSFILMIAGMPFFRPKLVLFPLPWVLGILTLFITMTVPFHFMKHSCHGKDGSEGHRSLRRT